MNKKISMTLFGLTMMMTLTGCEKNEVVSNRQEKEVIYDYAIAEENKEISADGQFESSLGLVTEQPVYDLNGNKVGKRLYVDSSKEKITEESVKKFYKEIENIKAEYNVKNEYNEITISIEDNKVVNISLVDKEVWNCSINENMELKKIEKIYQW